MDVSRVMAGLMVSGVLCGAASASLIASEDFSYGDGTLDGANGGTGWASAWADEGSGGGATRSVAGGQAQISFSTGGGYQQVAAERVLSGTVNVAGGVWIRATVQKTASNGGANSFGGINLFNGGAEVGLIGNFWPGVAVDAWGAGPNLVQGEIATELVTTVSDVVIYLDSTQTLLWVNADPGNLGAAEATGAAISDFDRIRLRGGSEVSGTETWAYDNILIGTTAADVGVVPEPTSLALLGLGGLALMRRR